MRHAKFWIICTVVAASLVVWAVRRREPTKTTSDGARLSLSVDRNSEVGELNIDAEVGMVTEIGRQWSGLTVGAVRKTYRIMQETNQVPWVLELLTKNDRNGDEVRLSFEKGVLFEVIVTRTNGSSYQMFLNHDGRVLSYVEWTNQSLTGMICEFYTNGQLQAVIHQSNGMWVGTARFYAESGDLVLSTNYSEPTMPVSPSPALSHLRGHPLKVPIKTKSSPVD
jgi:hypothetical protein